MNGEERRRQIVAMIGADPVTATALAERFGVSPVSYTHLTLPTNSRV